MVSAPKKIFSHAVDRNRIKRLIREAIRTELPAFQSYLIQKGHSRFFSITYTGKKLPDYQQTHKAIRHLFALYIKQHQNGAEDPDTSTDPPH